MEFRARIAMELSGHEKWVIVQGSSCSTGMVVARPSRIPLSRGIRLHSKEKKRGGKFKCKKRLWIILEDVSKLNIDMNYTTEYRNHGARCFCIHGPVEKTRTVLIQTDQNCRLSRRGKLTLSIYFLSQLLFRLDSLFPNYLLLYCLYPNFLFHIPNFQDTIVPNSLFHNPEIS